MSPNNVLEHNDVIDKLQYYVLNSKNIGKILRTQIKKPEKLKKIEKQKVKRTNFFVPSKDDILFLLKDMIGQITLQVLLQLGMTIWFIRLTNIGQQMIKHLFSGF